MLALRSRIFVVEQTSVYQDCDGLDKQAMHLMIYNQGTLIASARILPPDSLFPELPAIGRVVVVTERRGEGLGHRLMREAVRVCRSLYPGQTIRISAQQHLSDFYAGHGFEIVSEPYLEDGIWHVAMLNHLDAEKPEVSCVD